MIDFVLLVWIKKLVKSWNHPLNKSHIISTDEDPGLRVESFPAINLGSNYRTLNKILMSDGL